MKQKITVLLAVSMLMNAASLSIATVAHAETVQAASQPTRAELTTEIEALEIRYNEKKAEAEAQLPSWYLSTYGKDAANDERDVILSIPILIATYQLSLIMLKNELDFNKRELQGKKLYGYNEYEITRSWNQLSPKEQDKMIAEAYERNKHLSPEEFAKYIRANYSKTSEFYRLARYTGKSAKAVGKAGAFMAAGTYLMSFLITRKPVPDKMAEGIEYVRTKWFDEDRTAATKYMALSVEVYELESQLHALKDKLKHTVL